MVTLILEDERPVFAIEDDLLYPEEVIFFYGNWKERSS